MSLNELKFEMYQAATVKISFTLEKLLPPEEAVNNTATGPIFKLKLDLVTNLRLQIGDGITI